MNSFCIESSEWMIIQSYGKTPFKWNKRAGNTIQIDRLTANSVSTVHYPCSCSIPKELSSVGLRAPISQIKEIIANRAVAEFGNGGQDTFELSLADAFQDMIDKLPIKACIQTCFGRIALIHK